jgi:hypothetical protein
VNPDKIRREINPGNLATGPLGRSDRFEQSIDFRGQFGGASGVAEGAQDSRVLAVAIARGQPIGAMEFRSPAQERKTVWRWLGVADEHAIDVDVEVTSRAVRHTGVLIDPIVIWDS